MTTLSRRPSRRISGAAILLAALAAAGCSSKEPKLAEVRGTVTFNGLPAHAEIIFDPRGSDNAPGGRPSTAWTDSDGSFRMKFSEDRPGAIAGLHRVTLRIMRNPSNDPDRSHFDSTSPQKLLRLNRTVSRGANEFHFSTRW